MINTQKSLTLFEILIVIGIVAVLISLTIPLGVDFYKSQQLETHSQGIVQTLRKAQFKAMSQEGDSSFGVYFTNDNYILFKGESFTARDFRYDEIFSLPVVINLSGLSEVVFSKLEGEPNVTGNIIISSDSSARIININTLGRINYE